MLRPMWWLWLDNNACYPAVEWASKYTSFKEAWKACPRADWLYWLVEEVARDQIDQLRIPITKLFEKVAPKRYQASIKRVLKELKKTGGEWDDELEDRISLKLPYSMPKYLYSLFAPSMWDSNDILILMNSNRVDKQKITAVIRRTVPFDLIEDELGRVLGEADVNRLSQDDDW